MELNYEAVFIGEGYELVRWPTPHEVTIVECKLEKANYFPNFAREIEVPLFRKFVIGSIDG